MSKPPTSKYNHNNPFPIRLGELKPKLQQIAFSEERTLQNLIRKVLSDFIKKNDTTKQS